MELKRLAAWSFTSALILASVASLARPAAAAPGAKATGFDVGDRFACAVMATHHVECWGLNDKGQLGDGTITKRLKPVTVIGISKAVAVSAGVQHACAVLSTGEVKCWGFNGDGQLGDGTTTERHHPVTVIGIHHAVRVSAGAAHTCALSSGGSTSMLGRQHEGGTRGRLDLGQPHPRRRRRHGFPRDLGFRR